MPRLAVALAVALAVLIVATMAAGQTIEPRPEKIVAETTVAAPRAEVWKAITTREGLGSFLTTAGRVELRPGGPYELFFDPTAEYGRRGSETCRVLSYVEHEMLSVTWNAPPTFEGLRGSKTFVVFQLSDGAERGTTRIRITHDGFRADGQWPDVRAYFAAAWPNVLGALRAWFEAGATIDPRFADPPELQPYVYFIRPARPGFFEGTTEAENVSLHGHVRHIEKLLDEGRLVLAGPSVDPAGVPSTPNAVPMSIEAPGIVIFLAADAEEARRIMEADPAVADGVFKAQVNRFFLSYLRE